MSRKKKIWLAILALTLCLLGLLAAEIYRSNCRLTVKHYRVENGKITAPVRIVQLTDLHNAQFGENNADLVAQVRAQQPDLILLTGDLVTGSEENTAVAKALLEDLVQLAPVYVSIGNHEQLYEKAFGTDLTALFESTGARVLEFSYEDALIAGQMLRVGGISGYCLPEIYLKTGEAKVSECDFLKDFQNTDCCTLLMSHLPIGWINNDAISYWDADLVFSGHTHGGQIVLPLLGPMYAPDMGLFPGRLEGLYPSADGEKTLVLSTGLGSSVAVPRLNNPPQIMVVDLLPKE